MFESSGVRYCAFCRTKRSVYLKKHMNWLDGGVAVILSVLLMLVVKQGFDPAVIVISCFMVILTEIVVQVRRRLSIVCQFCGFDPFLYLRSHEKAAQRVTEHLEKRKQDPDFALSDKPFIYLPRIKKTTVPVSHAVSKAKGQRISTQV